MNREEKIKDLQRQADEMNRNWHSLQDQLDELKAAPVSEVGKWYKRDEDIIFVTKFDGKQISFYGYYLGKWVGRDWMYLNTSVFIEATTEEVETALIEEAKRRGFKEGVIFYYCNGGSKGIIGEFVDETYFYDNQLRFKGSTIFENGKWAEIITEPKVVVNRYEMEQDGDVVNFGCARFYKRFFDDVYESIKYQNCSDNYGVEDLQNRNIKSITLDSGVEITVEQLKEIVKACK